MPEQNAGESFSECESSELIANAVVLLSLVRGLVNIEDICRLVESAPKSLAQTQPDSPDYAEWWVNSYLAECLRVAIDKTKTEEETRDLEVATDYWLRRFPELVSQTTIEVTATFSCMLACSYTVLHRNSLNVTDSCFGACLRCVMPRSL